MNFRFHAAYAALRCIVGFLRPSVLWGSLIQFAQSGTGLELNPGSYLADLGLSVISCNLILLNKHGSDDTILVAHLENFSYLLLLVVPFVSPEDSRDLPSGRILRVSRFTLH